MSKMLARGKSIESEVWTEGFYVHLYDDKGNESHRIYTGYAETDCGDYYPDWYEIDPTTLGRSTGLKDVHGRSIFEDDIGQSIDGIFLVRWSEEKCAFVMDFYAYSEANEELYLEEMWDDAEIIGNIHDNIELLKACQ